jgi:hypothetical protein
LDVHEFLTKVGLSDSFSAQLKPIAKAVAMHDACHMIHGQGIQQQPRTLLAAIPDLELREAMEAGVCCGSAGIYNLVQPEEAAELGTIKANDLSNTWGSARGQRQHRLHLATAPASRGTAAGAPPDGTVSGISRLASVAKPQTGCCRYRDCRGR